MAIIDYKTISEFSTEGLDQIVKEHLKDGWALRGDMVVSLVLVGRQVTTHESMYHQTMVLPDSWIPPIGGGR